jgi:hypothetical protein
MVSEGGSKNVAIFDEYSIEKFDKILWHFHFKKLN